MCSFLRPLHTMPCWLCCCHFHVAGVYAGPKFVACSQKDMACPIIVDRHKLSGASISCVLFRAHVLFVAYWFLLALACVACTLSC